MGADIIIAVNPHANVLGPRPSRFVQKEASGESAVSPDILDKLFGSIPDGVSRSLKSIAPGFLTSKSGAPGYIEVLSSSSDIMTTQILRSRLAGEPPHVMINPQLAHMSVLEFHRAAEAIEEGRRSVNTVMPLLQEYLS